MQESTESPGDLSAGSIHSAADIQPGDRVVYPKQGVCKVQGVQAKEIAGQRLEFISLVREEDSATILVPLAKVQAIGLRKVADPDELRDVFYLLSSEFLDPELDWKVRHRLHGDLLTAGGILGIAEVLKALQGLANLRPLPQKERERYNEARHLLVDEISVALGVPGATAEHFIDYALLPPPGTVRPPAKPGLVVELPPRPRPGRRAAKPAEEEDLDGELDLEELEVEPEEEAELAEEPEAEEAEAEEATRAKAKAPRKAAAPKESKAAKAGKAKKESKAPAKAKSTRTSAAAKAEAAAEAQSEAKDAAQGATQRKAGASKKGSSTSRAKGGKKTEAEEAPSASAAGDAAPSPSRSRKKKA